MKPEQRAKIAAFIIVAIAMIAGAGALFKS